VNGDNESGFDLFRWVMGVGGTLIGVVTMAGGRTVIKHERELGELKRDNAATVDAISQLRLQGEQNVERFNRVDDKLDRIRDSIERMTESKP
jgi:hypothetical protein